MTSSCARKEVPWVEWACLINRTLATDVRPFLLYRATLVTPDGGREEVELYLSPSPRHEALVLQELDSMAGIPRVYGVTRPGSETLVLGRTKGLTLDYWLDEGHTAVCMTALLHVCKIISRMHYLGISYGNLSVTNILVGVEDSGHLDVSLLGFHRGKRNATEEDIRADDKQMFSLIRDIIEDIKEESFRNIRDELRHLFEDTVGVLTLVEIVLLLCGSLNNHPNGLVPPYHPMKP
uniref:Protein kinase domain-containing protein n=1 Tax=Scylla olivacea TaxID=85551 RepID=A0A0P4W722_SCYOL